MSEVSTIGLDIAKSVFQVHGVASALLRVTIAWFSEGRLNETGVAITAVPTIIPSMTCFFMITSMEC